MNLLKANLNSVLGMIGGAMPALLAAAAVPLGILAGRWTRSGAAGNAPPPDPVSRTAEICFLGIWAAAGIYLAATGNRFGEIAALPVGLLAGLAV